MSVLIDQLLAEETLNQTTEEIDGKWYIAKPMPFYRLFDWRRFRDAYRIIIGRAHAYHYKIDEKL